MLDHGFSTSTRPMENIGFGRGIFWGHPPNIQNILETSDVPYNHYDVEFNYLNKIMH